jgi:hypothetical protein
MDAPHLVQARKGFAENTGQANGAERPIALSN